MLIKVSDTIKECYLVWKKHTNGNNALMARNVYTDKLEVIASINVQEQLLDDEIVINDYDGNRGVLYSLIHNGVVTKPVGWVQLYSIQAPVCRIIERKTK